VTNTSEGRRSQDSTEEEFALQSQQRSNGNAQTARSVKCSTELSPDGEKDKNFISQTDQSLQSGCLLGVKFRKTGLADQEYLQE
jgi:hypothetical protein